MLAASVAMRYAHVPRALILTPDTLHEGVFKVLTIRIIRQTDDSSAVKIRCAESELVYTALQSLKQFIHPAHRYFDPATHLWVVLSEGFGELEKYLERMTASYSAWIEIEQESEEERKTREARQQEYQNKEEHTSRTLSVERAYKLFHLQPSAPVEIIHAVYRALAKSAHPDVGGTNERMREINDAYQILMAIQKKEATAA